MARLWARVRSRFRRSRVLLSSGLPSHPRAAAPSAPRAVQPSPSAPSGCDARPWPVEVPLHVPAQVPLQPLGGARLPAALRAAAAKTAARPDRPARRPASPPHAPSRSFPGPWISCPDCAPRSGCPARRPAAARRCRGPQRAACGHRLFPRGRAQSSRSPPSSPTPLRLRADPRAFAHGTASSAAAPPASSPSPVAPFCPALRSCAQHPQVRGPPRAAHPRDRGLAPAIRPRQFVNLRHQPPRRRANLPQKVARHIQFDYGAAAARRA